jgi:hypothetical protein
MRRIALFLAIVVTIGFIVGCSSSTNPSNPEELVKLILGTPKRQR